MLDSFFNFNSKTVRKKSKSIPPVEKQFKDISYVHTINKRSRSYRLKIDSNKGLVLVTPPRFSQSHIEQFMDAHRAWIQTQLSKLHQKKDFLETETSIRIFDTVFSKKVLLEPGKASSIQLQDTSLRITVSENTAQKVAGVTHRFLKQTAEQYIVPRTKQLAEKMKTDYTRIKFGEHKTQWGSCHTNGTLTFNWRLVHAPTKVIDYVIIHELAHRTHLNHSASFWALVAKYDPHYEVHKLWLKRYGLSVG